MKQFTNSKARSSNEFTELDELRNNYTNYRQSTPQNFRRNDSHTSSFSHHDRRNVSPEEGSYKSNIRENNSMKSRTTEALYNQKRPISPDQILKIFDKNPQKAQQQQQQQQQPIRMPYRNFNSPVLSSRVNTSLASSLNPQNATTRTVYMARDPNDNYDHGFGVCVKARRSPDFGTYVSKVEEGSIADKSGLKPGDMILEANGVSFSEISYEDALKILKTSRTLSMTVISSNVDVSNLKAFHQYGSNNNIKLAKKPLGSWIDSHGRTVSPPGSLYEPSGTPIIHNRAQSASSSGLNRTTSKKSKERRIDLCIGHGQSLGLMIRGGSEFNLGIYITGIDKNSVAEKAGLRVGDQILEVNNVPFTNLTHDEAVSQLKRYKRMSILVKYVGKVPHSSMVFNKQTVGSGSTGRFISKRIIEGLQIIDEKARTLLPANEYTSLSYYLDEYLSQRMSIDLFVEVLFELLNTAEKYTLLTELREIVSINDRGQFDDLVYRYSEDNPYSKEPINAFSDEEIGSPSDDSGLGLGWNQPEQNQRYGHRIQSSCNYNLSNKSCFRNQENIDLVDDTYNENCERSNSMISRSESTTALHNQYDIETNSYFSVIRSQLNGWTQKVKSWYWGRPIELAQKLSRSFDFKATQPLLGAECDINNDLQTSDPSFPTSQSVPLEQLPQSLQPNQPQLQCQSKISTESDGNVRISIPKTKPFLGIAIEGGINTKHPLPRIINIHEKGSAFESGGLEVGQLILEVDGRSVRSLEHQEVAKLIADSYARLDKSNIEFLVTEAKKSNLEPKPTAYVFLEA